MVGHEVDHKIVSTSRDDRRYRPREVVRVVENRPPRVVVAVGGSLSLSVRLCHIVESLESAGFEGVHVPAVEVSVSLLQQSAFISLQEKETYASKRCVAFQLVVSTQDTSGGSQR
jgi:hypothetical protein